jgi:hypothetical protein
MGIKRCGALRKKKQQLQQFFKTAHITYPESSEREQMMKLQQIIEGTYLEEEKKLIEETSKK